MHAVAITRARVDTGAGYRDFSASRVAGREELAAWVAALTGRDLYDARMRVSQPLPSVVSMEPDAERARALVSQLRAKGLGAVSCAIDDARPWSARGPVFLELTDDALSFQPAGLRVPYDELRVVVLATLDEETSREEVEMVRVSTNARGQPTTMPVSRYRSERARLRAAYCVLGEGRRSVRVVQGALSLAGATSERTSFERFESAIGAMLARAPHARCDARLVDAKRARHSFSLRAEGREKVESNVRETDLAARLLGLAWLGGQIDAPESGG